MRRPPWFGKSYPTYDQLEFFAESMGAAVGAANIPFALFHPNVDGVPVILIPANGSPLTRCWALAHELGHLCQHVGPRGELLYQKDERAADRWAACALIPELRIQRHHNASLDSFIAALSRHYEDLPPENSKARALAGRIAQIRLGALAQLRSEK